MPRAKNKTSKLYVGKIFSLKASKSIACTRTKGQSPSGVQVSAEDLGGQVLVLDESIKKVEILPTSTTNPSPVWIAKYYLQSEIKEQIEGNPSGELSKIITELVSVKETLGNCHSTIPEASMRYTSKALKKVEQLIRRTRMVQESLEGESKPT